MKLPSHLVFSRHDVYSFRITYRRGQKSQGATGSLDIRNRREAKAKALAISLALMKVKMKGTYYPTRCSREA